MDTNKMRRTFITIALLLATTPLPFSAGCRRATEPASPEAAPAAADQTIAIPDPISIEVTDGKNPINAVIPVNVEIVDPEGRTAEFSGSYAAKEGRLAIRFDFASVR